MRVQEWGRGGGRGGGGEGEEEGVRERGRDEKKRGGGEENKFFGIFFQWLYCTKTFFMRVSCIGLGDLLAKN